MFGAVVVALAQYTFYIFFTWITTVCIDMQILGAILKLFLYKIQMGELRAWRKCNLSTTCLPFDLPLHLSLAAHTFTTAPAASCTRTE